MWSGLRSKINIKNKKCQNISLKFGSNWKTLSNHFDKFFTSIADKPLQKLTKKDERDNDFINFHNENSFFISPTDPEEVHNKPDGAS